jgi:hypothetical protein
MSKKSGRPRQNRERRKDGRLVPLIDKGNMVVQARRAAFEVFQGGKAGDQIGDPIGRAWAVGLLDGTAFDSAMLRDIGRRYAQLHSIVYRQTQCAVADHDRVRGTGAGNDNDHTGERFAKLDRLARDAGSKERLAMRKLCVDGSPDENPMWLGRLITDRTTPHLYFHERGCTAYFAQSTDRDRMIMSQALGALVAMVEGK